MPLDAMIAQNSKRIQQPRAGGRKTTDVVSGCHRRSLKVHGVAPWTPL